MKIRKIQLTAVACLATLMLGGCGEAAYDLTEKEENIIVNYSAHVLAKYNTYQKDGLTWVNTEEEIEAADEEEVTAPDESTEAEELGTPAEGDASGVQGDAVVQQPAQTATLNEIFGNSELQIDYVGVRLDQTYGQENYYVLDADAGKTYMIVGIDVTNIGMSPATVDNLSASPQFTATLNGTETMTSELTILNEDFSTYEAILEAGETAETVLLFQVPETVTAIEQLTLNVSLDGENYQIILESM